MKNLNLSTIFFNKNLGSSQRYTGFTLAEVLITLGIIGIVVNMTIPTLMNNVQNQEMKVALKKIYAVLTQATMSLMSDNSSTLKGLCNADDNDCFRNYYMQYLKTVKTCDNGQVGCFWGNPFGGFKVLDGRDVSVSGLAWGVDSSVILNDGTLIDFYYHPIFLKHKEQLMQLMSYFQMLILLI